jgi:hypothetical protein
MKLYVGECAYEPMQPLPPGAYAAALVGKGVIRRAVFHGETLDEVIRKAILAVDGSAKAIKVVRDEPRSKYTNTMLTRTGYRNLDIDQFLEAISIAKRRAETFMRKNSATAITVFA